MKNIQAIRYTPETLVGGCLPAAGANSREMVWHAAANALDTERVHLIFSQHDGFVYYLAAPSESLASAPGAVTELAAALPGMPGHLGDGVYRLALVKGGDRVVSVQVSRGSLQVFGGWLNPPGQHAFDLDEATPAHSWQGYNLGQTSFLRTQTAFLTKTGGIASLVGVVLFTLAVAAQSFFASASLERETKLLAQVNEVNTGWVRHQPIHAQIAGLQHIAATVTRAGGWLKKYNIASGKQDEWEARVPQWVTQDYWKAFGNVSADKADDGLLTVKSNNPKSTKGAK